MSPPVSTNTKGLCLYVGGSQYCVAHSSGGVA